MNTKLTLSIEQSVIDSAKEYAKRHGKSLSNIVEEYLKALSEMKSTKQKQDLTKIVRELKGSVKLPKEMKSYRELLEDALIDKYLK